MVKGGVSKTYVSWMAASAPYPDETGKKYYIKVINPKKGVEKEVRWYTDKNAIGVPEGVEDFEKPLYPLFDFTGDTENDWVWVIEKRWLSDDEIEKKFGWRHGWKGNGLFGPYYGAKNEWWKVGCYFAPVTVMEEELPEIAAGLDKYKKVNWPQWVKEAYKNTVEEGFDNPNNCWHIEYDRMKEMGYYD